ncbi:hypothetical protein DITRI_Ditri10aG0056000 [Diplodiscus trichospermus]
MIKEDSESNKKKRNWAESSNFRGQSYGSNSKKPNTMQSRNRSQQGSSGSSGKCQGQHDSKDYRWCLFDLWANGASSCNLSSCEVVNGKLF